MIENIKKNWPLLVLIVASLLVPANQDQTVAAVLSCWVLGWAVSGRNTATILAGIALAIFIVVATVHMATWQLDLWQGYFPLATVGSISFIASMAVNQKNK